MTQNFPCLLASHAALHWTLAPQISFDYFGFQKEGAGALLLIAMHLTDPMPWHCARQPLYFPVEPGVIDRESKRILGKRYKVDALHSVAAWEALDPIARVNEVTEKTGHSFAAEPQHPSLEKIPGKLLPRKLTAWAKVEAQGHEWTLHARNFSELSQCLHAELTLMFGLSQILSQLPQRPDKLDSFHLETTLKPCKMCASFLHVLRRKCSVFSVRYHEDDPGRLAAHTLLDQYGYRSPP